MYVEIMLFDLLRFKRTSGLVDPAPWFAFGQLFHCRGPQHDLGPTGYGDETLSRVHMFEEHKRFSGGRNRVEDDECSGRPS
ncbi:hypothetical protein TNCV_2315331 [Trichonephila clavipes]|nr:hypothetical protein TNCV_2315331 [Trichonephila clavipes]